MKNKLKLIILIILFSCKNESSVTNLSASVIFDEIEFNQDCLKNRKIKSITHSCGGGCAITYNEKKVSRLNSSIEVDYNAVTYINEEIDEKFNGSFYIKCNKQNKAYFIFYKDEPNKNILDVEVNSLGSSFQVYSDELCSCTSSNKKPSQKENIKVEKDFVYTCKDIEVKNSYEEPLYKTCECDYNLSKCYSIFYKKANYDYKKELLSTLPLKDTIFFTNGSKTEFKFYESDSLRISIIDEGGEELLFKKIDNKTIIEFYYYLP